MSDMLSGAAAMLILVLVLWFTYALGASHGRTEIREEAVEHGHGQFQLGGDTSSKFLWK